MQPASQVSFVRQARAFEVIKNTFHRLKPVLPSTVKLLPGSTGFSLWMLSASSEKDT